MNLLPLLLDDMEELTADLMDANDTINNLEDEAAIREELAREGL